MSVIIMGGYVISFLAFALQVSDVIPGVPDALTMAVIVAGLSTAVVMQWRQNNKNNEIYRSDMKEINDKMIASQSKMTDALHANTTATTLLGERLQKTS